MHHEAMKPTQVNTARQTNIQLTYPKNGRLSWPMSLVVYLSHKHYTLTLNWI